MSSSLDLLVAAKAKIDSAVATTNVGAGDAGKPFLLDAAGKAAGLTPSTAGAGWSTIIRDTGTKTWRIVSDGTDWFFSEMTKAT